MRICSLYEQIRIKFEGDGWGATVMAMNEVDVWVFHADLTGDEMRNRVEPARSYTSVSHSAGRSVLAASDVPIGIDVEYIRWHPYQDRLVARSMTEAEQDAFALEDNQVLAFTQHWTRIEAYLKAIGLGIRGGLLTRPPANEMWTFVELEVGDEHCATVAAQCEQTTVNVYDMLDDVHERSHDAVQPTRTQRFAGSALGATLGAGMIGLANAIEGRVQHDAPIVVEQGSDPDRDRVKLELDPDDPKASKITFRR